MILHEWVTEESIDRQARATFIKSLVVTSRGAVPIAMARTRAWSRDRCEGVVLLVHGFGQNRRAWHLPLRSPSNYLAAAGFDVFAIDLRGYGRSRDLGARRATDVSDHVREDIPAAVEEALRLSGAGSVFLVGHSLGGLLCYAAAPGLAGAVAGVVSLGSPYYFAAGQPGLRRFGDVLLWLDRMIGIKQVGVGLYPVAQALRAGRTLLESRLAPLPFRGYAPGSIEDDVLGEHMNRAMDFADLGVILTLFRSGVRQRVRGNIGGLEDYAQAFERLAAPLLVVAGRYDDLAPPESVRPAYVRSSSPDKTYRVLGHGHLDILVGRFAPQTTWPLLEGWLAKRARV